MNVLNNHNQNNWQIVQDVCVARLQGLVPKLTMAGYYCDDERDCQNEINNQFRFHM